MLIVITIVPLNTMSWNKVSTIPKGIFFGCFGNPIYVGEMTNSLCSCANTYEKHLENYKKYLYHVENYKKLNITFQKHTDIKLQGYYFSSQMEKINYPDDFS